MKSQELLSENFESEPSHAIHSRVVAARKIQLERYRNLRLFSNSQLSAKPIKQFCKLDSASLELIEKSIRKYHLSARAYHRVLKVARTIADLDGAPEIQCPHLAEAVQYRSIEQF